MSTRDRKAWHYSHISKTIKSFAETEGNAQPLPVANLVGWDYLKYTPNGEKVIDENGRLMAAAPEMLDVLEKIKYWCELQSMLECFNPDWRREMIDIIKEAKGEES